VHYSWVGPNIWFSLLGRVRRPNNNIYVLEWIQAIIVSGLPLLGVVKRPNNNAGRFIGKGPEYHGSSLFGRSGRLRNNVNLLRLC